MAKQIYERFRQKTAGDPEKRLSIPTIEETRQDILKRMLNGGLDPEDRRQTQKERDDQRSSRQAEGPMTVCNRLPVTPA